MRYKTILAAKIEEEKKEALQQNKLKKKNGITEKNVVVKKRTGKQFLCTILMGLVNLIRFVFAAIGILAMIEPTLREAFVHEIMSFLS